ncbi:MAG: response regulator [Alphaproteobacteria bacterium]|nr:response regulator [Alphaproteobacteria bacterium]MBU1513150.1 response regulator [Alphaproteobacteria bacterium]MBU2095258.1 response regulator [Alphaproteobacteria bacterium]MBU2152173.1 response regulator [Alphaproteobacteria bacterium]MBU2306780.1 response regulator [Alphaproteobacteria bacterium]
MADSSGEISRTLKVLHVDDDPMNLRVVQEILGAFGHQAVMACSGKEALERLACEAFDIMLLDIHMPGMTGIEVIERLRASTGPERSVPVIALTADVYSRRPAEYVALGFNDFVSKPILVSGLMATIRRCTATAMPAALSRTG